MKIMQGPFEGITIPDAELTVIGSTDPTPWWPTHNRTPVFLKRFPPEQGWSVVVRNEQGPFNLPDYRNTAEGQEPLIQPTQQFIAELRYKGEVVNSASSLEVIDGPKAWERGETNARGRLYEALGLPGSTRPYQHQLVDEPKPRAPTSGTNKQTGEIVPISRGSSRFEPKPEPAPFPVDDPADKAESTAEASPSEVSAPESASESHQDAVEEVDKPAETVETKPASKPSTPAKAAKKPSGINANLWAQIQQQSKLLRREIPEIMTNDDAKQVLKELLMARAS